MSCLLLTFPTHPFHRRPVRLHNSLLDHLRTSLRRRPTHLHLTISVLLGLACRTRKVKCNGAKPACSSCLKSAQAHDEDVSSIHCDYDGPDKEAPKRKRANGLVKVAELEAKIAELERVISSSESRQPLVAQVIEDPTHHSSGDMASFLSPSIFNSSPSESSSSSFDPLLQHFYSAAPNPLPTYVSLPVTPPDQQLFEIFYPGWPRDLPSPTLTSRLVEVFFNKSHSTAGMINQAKLLTSLHLPPTHANFPHVALIHAMCTFATRFVSGDFYGSEEYYWLKDGANPLETATEYHFAKSKLAIDSAIGQGSKLFQALQAIVLVCFHAYSQARFIEVWMYCGMATRMCSPLGLNHLRPPSNNTSSFVNMKPTLLGPCADDEDYFERSSTFWFVVACDRFSSASTGWALSLDEDDITSLLPSPGPPPPLDDLTTSPLCIQNPNFFMSNPPHFVHSLQLYFKSIVLLQRVVSFLQRSPDPAGPAFGLSTKKSKSAGSDDAPIDLRSSDAFKKLDADTVTFRLSLPREYQSMPLSAGSHLCLVHAIPHLATILLHEPFCTIADTDLSLPRCLLSARAILNGLYQLWNTSFDVGLLAPPLIFCWSIAGRTLVRELAIKQLKNVQGVDQVRAEVEAILNAMKAGRTPFGDASAANLRFLLDNPEMCLPRDMILQAGLGALDPRFCPFETNGSGIEKSYFSIAEERSKKAARTQTSSTVSIDSTTTSPTVDNNTVHPVFTPPSTGGYMSRSGSSTAAMVAADLGKLYPEGVTSLSTTEQLELFNSTTTTISAATPPSVTVTSVRATAAASRTSVDDPGIPSLHTYGWWS